MTYLPVSELPLCHCPVLILLQKLIQRVVTLTEQSWVLDVIIHKRRRETEERDEERREKGKEEDEKNKKVEEGRMESERGGGMEEGEGNLVGASQKGGHDVSSRLFEVVPVSL